MLEGNLRLLILRVGSLLKLSLLGGIATAEGAFHACLNQRHRCFVLAIHFSGMDTNCFTARAIGSASPESTNTPAGIHTDASLGLPRRYAMAPVLRDLSHEPEFLFLDGAAY